MDKTFYIQQRLWNKLILKLDDSSFINTRPSFDTMYVVFLLQIMFRILFFFLLMSHVEAFPKRFYGEWTLWHSTMPDLPDNRAVVHIYPENHLTFKYRFTRGPIVFHKTKKGLFRISNTDEFEEEKHQVDVSFYDSEEYFLSVYGIGLQNFNIKTQKKDTKTDYKFALTMVGTDDIYLRCVDPQDDCFHLVRSIRINEPSVDIPLSTFLITQIVGTLLGHVMNEWFFHSN